MAITSTPIAVPAQSFDSWWLNINTYGSDPNSPFPVQMDFLPYRVDQVSSQVQATNADGTPQVDASGNPVMTTVTVPVVTMGPDTQRRRWQIDDLFSYAAAQAAAGNTDFAAGLQAFFILIQTAATAQGVFLPLT